MHCKKYKIKDNFIFFVILFKICNIHFKLISYNVIFCIRDTMITVFNFKGF